MKKRTFLAKLLTLIVFVLLSALSQIASSQNQFIIGAEWLNKQSQVLSSTECDTAKSLGLNWGVISYKNSDTSGSYSQIMQSLQAAGSKGIKLAIDRGMLALYSLGQRWEYHPEFSGQYSQASLTGSSASENGATKFPDALLESANCRRVIAGSDQPGYVAKDLATGADQTDSVTYYLKIRMRLNDDMPRDTTPVVIVRALRNSDGHHKDTTIYAYQFSGYTYETIPAISFYKAPSGEFVASTQEAYNLSLQPLVTDDSIPYTLSRPDKHNDQTPVREPMLT
jgi:hypothetical protein